jgi:hypothetical protein
MYPLSANHTDGMSNFFVVVKDDEPFYNEAEYIALWV